MRSQALAVLEVHHDLLDDARDPAPADEAVPSNGNDFVRAWASTSWTPF